MKIRVRSVTRLLVIIAVFALGFSGTCPKPPETKGELTAFGAEPASVCINLGVPLVRVNWTVEGTGETCLSNVAINGSAVSGNIWNQNIQNGRCGEGNYSRQAGFSLRDVFGNNIPSNVTITADLTKRTQAGVFVSSEILDSGSATVTTRSCEAGVVPGG